MDDTSNILFARLRCLRRHILLGWGLLAVFVICAVLSVTSGFAVGLVLCMLGFAGDLFFIMRSQKAYRRLFKERLVRSELEKRSATCAICRRRVSPRRVSNRPE